jgi:hypothetical protein
VRLADKATAGQYLKEAEALSEKIFGKIDNTSRIIDNKSAKGEEVLR